MILVRDVFQAKYGQGSELVALLKESRQQWPGVPARLWRTVRHEPGRGNRHGPEHGDHRPR